MLSTYPINLVRTPADLACRARRATRGRSIASADGAHWGCGGTVPGAAAEHAQGDAATSISYAVYDALSERLLEDCV